MPKPEGKMGRGSSHWDPEKQAERIRLFDTHEGARRALVQWLRGKHKAHWEWDQEDVYSPSYLYQDGTTVIPVESRKAEEMEIVPMEISEVQP